MGEGHTDEPRRTRRLTVAEAAAALGITEGAVRNRVKRGTLRAEREAGRVYVLLAGPMHRGEPTDESELVATLREALVAERRANEENRRIIAMMAQRIPELEARQSPVSSEPTRTPTEDREEEHAATQRPEAGRRSWWREFFGI